MNPTGMNPNERLEELAGLPRARAPEGLWQSIDARLQAGHGGSRQPWLRTAALAALLATVGVAVLLWLNTAPEAPAPVTVASGPTEQESTSREPELPAWLQASALLEAELLATDSAVLDLDALGQLMVLEQRLAWIDGLLAEAPADTGLWQRRVETLEAIHAVHADQSWTAQLAWTTL